MCKHFCGSRHLEEIIMMEQEDFLPPCVECSLFQKNVNTPEQFKSEECKIYAESKKKQ